METSADEVKDRFLVTPQAIQEYTEWTNDEARRIHGVVDTVLNHVSRAIYNTTSADLEWIKLTNQHPLRRINKKDIEHIVLARDWEPEFAFSHVFCHLTEQIGRPPLWQEFNKFMKSDQVGIKMMGHEIIKRKDRITRDEIRLVSQMSDKRRWNLSFESIQNKARSNAQDALDWRLGNAYYGIMRDVWAVTKLRESGLEIKTHPLADALFRTDAWVGNVIVSLYVKNPYFKDETATKKHGGRKRRVESLLGSAENSFRFESITLEAAKEHGTFHVPTSRALKSAAEKVRAGLIHEQFGSPRPHSN